MCNCKTKPVYLESLGHIAVMGGVSVSEVQRILTEIGAQPVFVINCIPHFAAEVAGTAIARARGWNNLPAYYKQFHSEINTNAE
jgi:hypothetical protein